MDEPKRCASCDIELDTLRLIVDGSAYCCRGCAQGGPCTCSYVGHSTRYPRNGHSQHRSQDVYGDVW